MNPTLHQRSPDSRGLACGTITTLVHFLPVAEATGPQRKKAVVPSNECSKCPWSHTDSLSRADVVHILRCHFITTTELSKSCQPTRFSDWRNHESITHANPCQRLTTPNKDFCDCFPIPGQHPPRPGHADHLNYIGRNPCGNPHENGPVPV